MRTSAHRPRPDSPLDLRGALLMILSLADNLEIGAITDLRQSRQGVRCRCQRYERLKRLRLAGRATRGAWETRG